MADLDRGSGLSDAARTRHRHHPVSLEELDQRGDVGISTKERRSGIREVARQACEPLTLAFQEVRGWDRQPVDRDREDFERATHVLEFESPQSHESKLRLIPDLIVDG